MALDKNAKTFVMYVGALETMRIAMHLIQKAWIFLILADKALTKVLSRYFNYINVFLFNNTMKLPKSTGINEYIIKLEEVKQLFYGPIHRLGLIELEIVKTYIKTHLKTRFI